MRLQIKTGQQAGPLYPKPSSLRRRATTCIILNDLMNLGLCVIIKASV